MPGDALRKIDTLPRLETSRISLQTIVVAVDLSPISEKTVRIAANLARFFNSRLIISHIFSVAEGLSAGNTEKSRHKIAALAELAALDDLIPVAVLRQGNVVEETRKIVDERKADLLVLGTHGGEGVGKFVLGSTAESLFRSVSTPVLTVGPQIDPSNNGFTSILLATDLSARSLRAAQYATSFAEEYDAMLTLLHVLDPEHGKSSAVRENALQEMCQLISSDAELWCRPIFRTEAGDPAERILGIARDSSTDLIVMSVKRGPFATHSPWTIATRVVNHAACPVLTVRNGW
jgi:nucleotide-binding universal stress UspA family protein